MRYPATLRLFPLDLKTYLTTSKNLGQGKQNLVLKPSDLHKAKLLLLTLIHLFAREDLLVKKLEIQETDSP